MSGKDTNKTDIDIMEYIAHSILMIRRSDNLFLDKPRLNKFLFLTAISSYHLTQHIDKSLFKYLKFQVESMTGPCCNTCTFEALRELPSFNYMYVPDIPSHEHTRTLVVKPEVDWYTILSEKLGSELQKLIDDSLNYLFELNPLIFEYEFRDLINICWNCKCLRYIKMYQDTTKSGYYCVDLSPVWLNIERKYELPSECFYYKASIRDIMEDKDTVYAKDYPYIDLIKYYPEHKCYGKSLVKKYGGPSRYEQRTHYVFDLKFFHGVL